MPNGGVNNSHPYRTKVPFTRSALRSAISNGRLLNDVDARGPEMRRLKDLVSDLVSDLGGFESVSTAEMILIRRAAMLSLQCELFEKHWAQSWLENNGAVANKHALINYGTTANTLRRLLQAIGMKRVPRDVASFAGMTLEEAEEKLRERGVSISSIFDQPVERRAREPGCRPREGA